MNIFVSSLNFKVRKEDLAELFAPYGEVSSTRIIHDKTTRRSKGYGFVEMDNEEQAMAAIAAGISQSSASATIQTQNGADVKLF